MIDAHYGSIPLTSTDRYYLTAAVGGSCVKVKTTLNGQVQSGGGCRGEVRGFSRRSRKRLLDWINSIPRETVQNGLFITLTYHLKWGDTFHDWKRDIDTFGKRLRRKFPKAIFVWKLEWQKRGAPHFHILAFGVPFIAHRWVARSWNDIVDAGNEKHLAAGTQVKGIQSFGGVVYYAAKYIAKVEELPDGLHTGRIWGIIGRDNVEILWFWVELTLDEYKLVKRALRRWVARKLHRRKWRAPPAGLTAYVSVETAYRLVTWAQSAAEPLTEENAQRATGTVNPATYSSRP